MIILKQRSMFTWADALVLSFTILQALACGLYLWQKEWATAILWFGIATANSAILWTTIVSRG